MSKEPQVYACKSATCPLGTVGAVGYFTSGITAEQRNVLTGDPIEAMEEGEDFGEGVCPNCGTKGEAVTDG